MLWVNIYERSVQRRGCLQNNSLLRKNKNTKQQQQQKKPDDQKKSDAICFDVIRIQTCQTAAFSLQINAWMVCI